MNEVIVHKTENVELIETRESSTRFPASLKLNGFEMPWEEWCDAVPPLIRSAFGESMEHRTVNHEDFRDEARHVAKWIGDEIGEPVEAVCDETFGAPCLRTVQGQQILVAAQSYRSLADRGTGYLTALQNKD